MQIRFREYDEKNDTYKLIGYIDIKDYAEAFKMFTFMKKHECEYCIEYNTEDTVETPGKSYFVENLSFVFSMGETMPHIAVDVVEEC